MIRVALVVLLSLGDLVTAKPPPRLEPFWAGLERGHSHATAAGIVTLTEPIERRIRIAGGRFIMGSTETDMRRGAELCAREPLGPACLLPDGIAPYFRAEGHVHEVTVSDFELDSLEVTVRAYRRCVSQQYWPKWMQTVSLK